MKYLSTSCIEEAFKKLQAQELPLKARSLIHMFFICKSLGVSNLKSIKKDDLPKAYDYAFELSSLFGKNEKSPSDKNDWVNPMNAKERLSVSEPLTKWMSSRLSNNIFGGGTQWRDIVKEDVSINGDEVFKFRYDYVSVIKKLLEGRKINISALSLWFSRFREFDREESLGSLIAFFKKETHITDEESAVFFSEANNLDVSYTESPFDTSSIRRIIGLPQGEVEAWLGGLPLTKTENKKIKFTTGKFINMENNSLSKELLKKILEEYYQVILSGPPGTSKSYFANEVGKDFTDVLHVQFHPQYSYQEFIGGYVVDGSDVHYEDGVLVDFIEKKVNTSADPNSKFLVIIDEINRANTSQVFGEAIQCLDRGNSIQIRRGGNALYRFEIPSNLYIIGTMNSTDKSVGSMDLALKRRFTEIYCAPNPSVLLALCPSENGFISLSDFLRKLNKKLNEVTKNRELVVGHAIFLQSFVKGNDGLFHWDFEKFNDLFNFKILPMVEDYCDFDFDNIRIVLGNELPDRLSGDSFKNALISFMSAE